MFGGAVKIGPARCQKAVVPRDIGVLAILRGIMAACHNFYALSSQLAKFVEERAVLELRIGIPARMSDNGPSARIANPADGIGQPCPTPQNIGWFDPAQKKVKDGPHGTARSRTPSNTTQTGHAAQTVQLHHTTQ